MAASNMLGFQSPTVSYGQSGGGIRLPLGAPVYRDASNLYRLAGVADASKCPAVGVVALTNPQNSTIGVINVGFLTLYNWSAITGTANLSVGSTYYLSMVPGKLTTSVPGPAPVLVQAVGVATGVFDMQILGNISLKPSSGLTLTVPVADMFLAGYWSLIFQNGLLASAVHHKALITPPVMDDGAGGFWKLAVNSSGAVFTIPDIGPATDDVVLEDPVGGFWKIVVPPSGLRGTDPSAGPATVDALVLPDELGNPREVVVDAVGHLGSVEA